MKGARLAIHLVRRLFGSLSNRDPADADLENVRRVLLPGEFSLWTGLQGRDKRHSIQVWRTFVGLRPDATRPEQAAALLHDLGKANCRLGPLGRVGATLFGGVTPRFREYRDHENIGRQMLVGVSDARTLDLLTFANDDDVSILLRRADDN